jgi:hypothetical protein
MCVQVLLTGESSGGMLVHVLLCQVNKWGSQAGSDAVRTVRRWSGVQSAILGTSIAVRPGPERIYTQDKLSISCDTILRLNTFLQQHPADSSSSHYGSGLPGSWISIQLVAAGGLQGCQKVLICVGLTVNCSL